MLAADDRDYAWLRDLLDDIDCALLSLLRSECDMPHLRLAGTPELSPAAASRRVAAVSAPRV